MDDIRMSLSETPKKEKKDFRLFGKANNRFKRFTPQFIVWGSFIVALVIIILLTQFTLRSSLERFADAEEFSLDAEQLAQLSREVEELAQVAGDVTVAFKYSALFTSDVIFEGDIVAPNVVYEIAAGPGITLAGDDPQRPTITNTGVTGLNALAGDIELVAGENIVITNEGNTITIDAEDQTTEIDEDEIEEFIFDGDNSGTLSSGTLALGSLSYSGNLPSSVLSGEYTGITGVGTLSNLFVAAGTFSVGGNALYVDGSNDRVGIGTSNANDTLEVAGNATIGSGYAGLGTTAPTNGLLVEGNVGIGTSAPAFTLDVNGSLRTTGTATFSNGIVLGGDYVNEFVGSGLTISSNTLQVSLAAGGGLTFSSGNLSLVNTCNDGQVLQYNSGVWECATLSGGGGGGVSISGSPQAGYVTYWANSTTITGESSFYYLSSSDRVGIGTTAPLAPLDVAAITWLRGSTASSGGVYVGSNGNVGIGNTNPSKTLDISGTLGVSQTATFMGGIVVGGEYASDLTGAGLSLSTGTLVNTGVTYITGTANQVNVSGTTGAVTLSLPQNIDTAATVQFGALTIGGDTISEFMGNGLTVASNTLALRLSATGGLTFNSGSLSLLTSCSDNEVLAWISSTWSCSSITGVGGITRTGSPAGGYLTFWSGSNAVTGESALFYDPTNDRLGIGTTAPGQSLSVAGSIGIGESGANPQYYTIFQGGDQSGNITYTLPTGGGSANYVLMTDGSGNLSWQSATGGSVGAGDISAVGNIPNGDAFTSGTPGSELYFGGGGFLGLGSGAGRIQFVDSATDTIGLVSANIGIGTTAPARSLDVVGTFRASDTATFGTGIILGGQTYTSLVGAGLSNAGGTLGLSTTGVVSGTYGSSSLVPVVSVDQYGRINNLTSVAIASGYQNWVLSDLTIATAINTGNTVTFTAGAGIGVSNANGNVTFRNTGVTYITGTANQVSVSGTTGAITLSLPQNIDTAATVQFGALAIGGDTISEFMGNGLTVSSNTLSLKLATASGVGLTASYSGLELGSSGFGLLTGCGNNEVLSWNGSRWGCSTINGLNGISGSGTTNYLAKFSGTNSLTTGLLYDTGSAVGLGTTTPSAGFDVQTTSWLRGGTGTSGIYVDASGNVGIGTTAPTVALDISGGAVKLTNGNAVQWGNSNYGIYGHSSTGYLRLKTANIDRLHINSSGNIGISTTAPTSRLSIAGGVGIGTTAANSVYHSTAVAPDGGLIVEGNVGIGTTNPAFKLDVNGSLRVSDTATFSNGIVVGGQTYTSLIGTGLSNAGGSLGFATTGVTAGTYGSSSIVPVISIDAFGRISNITTAAIAGGYQNWVLTDATIASTINSGTTVTFTTAGGGIGVSNAAGTITFRNTGVTYITGTANQVSVSGTTGAITLSLPQNIDTAATVQFGALTIGGDTISEFMGNGLTVSSNTLSLRLASAGTGVTASFSGLQVDGSGLRLLSGCGSNEVLAWTGSQWSCSTINGINGISGTGVTNYIARFSGTNSLTTGLLYDTGTAVGLGTTAPRAGLDVASTAWLRGSTANSGGIYINSSGNVGIGKTNPSYALDVTGSVAFDGSSLFVNSSTHRVGIGTTNPTYLLDVSGTVRFDGSSFFVDSTNKRVGIGTTTPAYLLDVAGTVRFDGSTFFVNASNDRVGIGTTNPSYPLDVVGSVSSYNLLAHNLTLSRSFASTLTSFNGFDGYTNFSGGIGTGGKDSLVPSERITSSGDLVNIGAIQAGSMHLSRGGTFASRVNYTTGSSSNPNSIALADFNGDGKKDMATTNNTATTMSVFINSGTGGAFIAKVDYSSGTNPNGIAAGDLNGDGFADLVLGNSSTVSVFLNNGNGTFASRVTYSTANNPTTVAIGDVNGDGKADIVTANNTSTSASVLINNGNGTFAANVDYTTGSGPHGVALADVNADGKADMIVSNSGATSVSVLMNNGDGTFATKVDYTSGTNPQGLAVGDLNGDAKPDIAVPNFNSTSFSVFINSGTGTFATKVDYTTGSNPSDLAMGDVNGDGKTDIAVTNQGSATISVFINNGDGTFATKVDYSSGSAPDGLAIGDVNGDNKADIVGANSGSSNASVYLNNLFTTFYASATGTVGIGTTNPLATLDVLGTSWLRGSTASSGGLFVDSSGNIGIGITAPSYKLDVQGTLGVSQTATFNGGVSVGGDFINEFMGSGLTVSSNTLSLRLATAGTGVTASFSGLQVDGSGLRLLSGCQTSQILSWDGSQWVCSSSGSASGWTDGGTNVYLTTNTDKVGIGTTAPTSKLGIAGGVGIGTTSVSSVYHSTAIAPDGGLIIEGNVGIGTTNPAYSLQVAGRVNLGSTFPTSINGPKVILGRNNGTDTFCDSDSFGCAMYVNETLSSLGTSAGSAGFYGAYTHLTNTTTNSNFVAGGHFEAIANAPSTAAEGVAGVAKVGVGVTVNNIRGAFFGTGTEHSSGVASITDVRAAWLSNSFANNTIITNLYGIHADLGTLGTGSSATNYYGIYVDSTPTGGTIQNGYGVYLTDVSRTTNDFGIYQEGANDTNYFAGNTGMGTTAPSTLLDLFSSSSTLGLLNLSANSLTTGTAANISLNGLTTGTGFNITSTSSSLTSGSLMNIDWLPSSTATATGDLFRLNIGSNGYLSGNVFALYNNSSDLFKVGTSKITSAVPHEFTANGDVSLGNDLIFTNQIASYVQSFGPLTIESGEIFENQNLTLRTFGTGDLVLDLSGSGGILAQGTDISFFFDTKTGGDTDYWMGILDDGGGDDDDKLMIGKGLVTGTTPYLTFDSSGNVGIGTTSPTALLTVNGSINATFSVANTAALCYDGTSDSNITDCSGSPVDIAEMYGTESEAQPGDIVSINIQTTETKDTINSSRRYDSNILGVVSTFPSGDPLGEDSTKTVQNAQPIALLGRVPVKVNLDNGTIRAGDPVTSSNMKGVGMKSTVPGRIIGWALEDFDGSKKQSAAVLEVHDDRAQDKTYRYWKKTITEPPQGVGKIMVMINPSWHDPTYQLAADGTFEKAGETNTDTHLSMENKVNDLDMNMDILEEKFASLSASMNKMIENTSIDQVSSLVTTVKELQIRADLADEKMASLSARITFLEDNLLAGSGSAVLGVNSDGTISTAEATLSNLSVTGETNLYDLGISGIVTSGFLTINGLDDSLSTPSASINTIGGPLKIQPLALEKVDFMDGKVEIDELGNMNVLGQLTAKVVRTEKLEIIEPVEAEEGSPSGEFERSIGESILKAGKSEIVIETPSVTDKSKIYVTFNGEYLPATRYWISTKVEGKSFTIKLDDEVAEDVSFSWLIVN